MGIETPRDSQNPIFSFIIVNYKSARHLPACFSSFRNITLSAPFECIVANNDPEEISELQSLQKRFPFTLITLAENRGFGFAVNRAAERARGTILVILNPDARFLEGDMSLAARAFRKDSSLGILGMKLFIELEMPQPWSVGTRVTLINTLRNHSGFPEGASLWSVNTRRSVGWVSGAAFMIPRKLFFRVHGFDEKFFLYYEDVDLCLRLRRFGKKIVFFPDIHVLHLGGGSMGASKNKQKKSYFISQDRYFALHRPWYERMLLKFLRGVTRMKNEE